MMIARLRGKPTPVRKFRPDFPEALELAIMKSLETEPHKRYETTLEFGHALVDALETGDKARLKAMLA